MSAARLVIVTVLPGARIVHDTAGNADDAWARLVPDLDPLLQTTGERT